MRWSLLLRVSVGAPRAGFALEGKSVNLEKRMDMEIHYAKQG